MKSPLLAALAVTALALGLGFAGPWAWRSLDPEAASRQAAAARAGAAPWEILVDPARPGQSAIFGLQLPGTPLDRVQARWADEVRFAVVGSSAAAGSPADARPAALEGHVERFVSAGVSGRLLLAFEARPDDLARWQAAHAGTPTGTGARRHALPPEALDATARAAPLSGLTFLPAAGLDADTLLARFGPPAQRRLEPGGTEHWLYPPLGLAIALPRKGRAVLQYVAPAEFERRLSAPLAGLPEPSALGEPTSGVASGAASASASGSAAR